MDSSASRICGRRLECAWCAECECRDGRSRGDTKSYPRRMGDARGAASGKKAGPACAAGRDCARCHRSEGSESKTGRPRKESVLLVVGSEPESGCKSYLTRAGWEPRRLSSLCFAHVGEVMPQFEGPSPQNPRGKRNRCSGSHSGLHWCCRAKLAQILDLVGRLTCVRTY